MNKLLSNTPRRFSAQRRRSTPRGLRLAALLIMIPGLILSTATPSTAMYASFRATLAKVPALFYSVLHPQSEPAPSQSKQLSREQLWLLVQNESKRQNVPAHLVWGLIGASSNFEQDARSPSGAVGFMQVMPGTAKDLRLGDIDRPEQNIAAGVGYLKKLLQQYDGQERLAIAAYRFGPGAVQKSQPLSDSVDRFVSNVIEQSRRG